MSQLGIWLAHENPEKEIVVNEIFENMKISPDNPLNSFLTEWKLFEQHIRQEFLEYAAEHVNPDQWVYVPEEPQATWNLCTHSMFAEAKTFNPEWPKELADYGQQKDGKRIPNTNTDSFYERWGTCPATQGIPPVTKDWLDTNIQRWNRLTDPYY